MTRNEYHTRINEFGDKAWRQTPTLPPLPTKKEQQQMTTKETNLGDTLPYVMIVHKMGDAFYLNRRYQLLSEKRRTARTSCLLQFFFKNQSQSKRGWLPTQDSQSPAWAKPLHDDDFTAYWIKDHFDADPERVRELSGIIRLPDLPIKAWRNRDQQQEANA